MNRNIDESKTNQIASTHLGSAGSYAITTDKFDPSLLVAIPRSEARQDWDINDDFSGFDAWHCHESTFLTNTGMPIAGTLKIIYPSNSECIVESKSFKLYLNTFDMCMMGETVENSIENYVNQVKKDLSNLLNTVVYVKFFWIDNYNVDLTREYGNQFVDLQDMVDVDNLRVDKYRGEDLDLQFNRTGDEEGGSVIGYSTNVLRSRCRHTKQKDTGSAFITIKYKSDFIIDPSSLLQKIISLREVDEFHEFCSEKIYTDIMKYKEVEACCVTLLYSRRGSLDINPCRHTPGFIDKLGYDLSNINLITEKTQGQ